MISKSFLIIINFISSTKMLGEDVKASDTIKTFPIEKNLSNLTPNFPDFSPANTIVLSPYPNLNDDFVF